MKFIELTGDSLRQVISDDELRDEELHAAGVVPTSVARVNEQGDIEIRRPEGWQVIGGLLGDYEARLKATTGLDWA